MDHSRAYRARLLIGLLGLLLQVVLDPTVQAQEEQWLRQRSERKCPQPPCPEPVREPLQIPPSELKPGEMPTITPPSEEPVLGAERFGAGAGETVALATPNMIGDFLGSSELRCVPVQITTIVPQTILVTIPPGTPVNVTQGFWIVPPNNNPNFELIPAQPGQPPPPNAINRAPIVVTFPTSTTGNQTALVTANLPLTTTTQACSRIPAVCHEFKISEDESPRPQDRVYVSENYYDHVFTSVNRQFGSDVGNMSVNQATAGFEKTFFSGNASIGMRIPYNSLNVWNSGNPQENGEFTDIGDLTIILKIVLWEDRETGTLISGGLAVTVPTGADSFGNAGFTLGCTHSTLLQPYLGYIWTRGDFFLHGFSAVEIPTASGDSVIMYNDIGAGYFVLRDPTRQFLVGVAPTVELHVNTPLSNQGNITTPGWTPDVVDVTEGVTFLFRRPVSIAIGVAEPITGPRPFGIEAIAQLNVRF